MIPLYQFFRVAWRAALRRHLRYGDDVYVVLFRRWIVRVV